ncbi:SDR family oxidoreductase [Chitinophaga rhizophila]|uniref:SDR family oxidoreductase n=1 Tax=Chitinophaga rhizophila TaxID=2866212 RepID=A0ABS7GJM9_9BACT|nr:SDR family oxidoreductase [Chitinophaga rhizophila]MBW8687496.1 SDR family oxidoreductase [Chitinophaga rhizophila]
MRVFVTGATGFVGSAVVKELIGAGHEVLGLARSAASAEALMAAGAAVHHGSLEDLESLRQGAAASEAVIHTAFIHDFSKYEENCETDRHVIEAIGAVLEGSRRPFIITSGTAVVSAERAITEDDLATATASAIPRVASEEAAAAIAARGVNASVLRLPPSVHGDGDHGFVPALINIAREKGISAYIGDGNNRWPAVHRLDAARVYRLIIEKGEGQPVFHAIGDEGVPVKDIATAIGKGLGLPVGSISPAEAAAHFGWLGIFAGLDLRGSAAKTKTWLGWKPEHVGLIEDLEKGRYF